MDQLTPDILQSLIETRKQACISIFMPTNTKSAERQQNPIRLENLLKKAKLELKKHPLVTHDAKEALQQAHLKLEDDDFWLHPSNSLAVFISQDTIGFLRLPLEFKELVIVGPRFHLKPLLPILTTNGKYFILTLSQSDIKLYQATRTTIDKLYLKNTPRSMQEFLGEDVDVAPYFHTKSIRRASGKNTLTGAGGSAEDDLQAEIERFLKTITKHIDKILYGQQAPLILAGVEQLTNLYRKHSDYKHILDNSIEGNFEHLGKQDIHEKAWAIAKPYFKQQEKQALDAYHSKAGSGKTSTSLHEILPAAFGGRVEALFVERDRQMWGTFDEKKGKVQIHKQKQDDSIDLMDLAVVLTLQNSGTAYSLKTPEMDSEFMDTNIAALYRY